MLLKERSGGLILPERAGVYQQLGQWALTVSPTDIEGTAEVLWDALTIPQVQRAWRAEQRGQQGLEPDLRHPAMDQLQVVAEPRNERERQQVIIRS